MENKYAKDVEQDKNREERLVDYDYKTNFKFQVVKVKEKNHKDQLVKVNSF